MPKNLRFWRNVTLIGLVHVAVITALVRWSRETKTNPQSIVWMNGGAGDGAGTPAKPASPPKPKKIATPPPEPKAEVKDESEEDGPVLTSAKSDIQLPTPTVSPRPISTPKPTPMVKATPKPTAKPKPTPKPSPKPTPKPSPKKTVLAKASLKPSPKIKPTPEESGDKDEEADAEMAKKEIAKAALAKKEAADNGLEKPPKAVAAQPGTGKGTSAGGGGHAGGAGGASEFGWYGSMLHDRFYSEWVQPTTIATTAKISALVKIRIEKDGRVSSFDIIKPSGNALVDESVAAVAKRVTEVDPLPAGLGTGEHYDVKINFELNSEQ